MEKDYGRGKKATYSYEEVRPLFENAVKDRARYLGAFYKVMPRELFDEYAKKALWEYGCTKAKLNIGDVKYGDVKGYGRFLENCTSVANTCADKNTVIEESDEKSVVTMEGKCALVQGWEDMGLAPEEVDYLCKIACYGDYGHTDALGLKGVFNYTSSEPDHDYCLFTITKKQD